MERVGIAVAGIERQALEREQPGGIVRYRGEGGELVPGPLAVDVARRADREEDRALADAVEDLVERMVALEPPGVEIDVDLVAAAEPLLQRDAEVLLELLDPCVAERVHLVVGVGVADEHIVFVTMHERHGQSRFRLVARAFRKSRLEPIRNPRLRKRLGPSWRAWGTSCDRRHTRAPQRPAKRRGRIRRRPQMPDSPARTAP